MTARFKWLLLSLPLLWACAPSAEGEHSVWEDHGTWLRKTLTTPGSSRERSYVPGRVLVRFRDGVDDAAAQVIHGRLGGTLTRKLMTDVSGGLHKVQLVQGETVPQAVLRYRSQPEVLYAEPDYILRATALPNDARLTEQWAHLNLGQTSGTTDADMNTAEGWTLPLSSYAPVVGIVDSGIDLNHPDLAPRLWTNTLEIAGNGRDDDGNGYVDDVHGIDVTSDTAGVQPNDTFGHGTHVAGIVAAQSNNGAGVAGVATTARLAICRFLGSDGAGTTSGALECLQYLRKLRTRASNPVPIVVTTNSYGGGDYTQSLVDEIAAQRAADMLFVVAAGNDHTDNDALGDFPADLDVPNVISVTASDASDRLASFASFGRRTVQVTAPGEAILSTFPDNDYFVLDGTSMAVPHVAGLVAMLKAQDPSRTWKQLRNLTLSGGQVKSGLTNLTLTGRRIRMAGTGGVGSMTCSNQVVKARRSPSTDDVVVSVGTAVRLSMLNINCANPAGAVSVQVSGAAAVPLRDDGVSPDEAAGDGSYTGSWTPTVAGTSTLTFADGSTVRAIAMTRARTVIPAPAPVIAPVGQVFQFPIALNAANGSGPWRIEGQFVHEATFTADSAVTVTAPSGILQARGDSPGVYQGLVRALDVDGTPSVFSQMISQIAPLTPYIWTMTSTQLVARSGQKTTFVLDVNQGVNDAGPWTVQWDVGYTGSFTPEGSATITSTQVPGGIDYTFASDAPVTFAARISSAAGVSPVVAITVRGGYQPQNVALEPVVAPAPVTSQPSPDPQPVPDPVPSGTPNPGTGGGTADPVLSPGPLYSPWIGIGNAGNGGASGGSGAPSGFVDYLHDGSGAGEVTGGCSATADSGTGLEALASLAAAISAALALKLRWTPLGAVSILRTGNSPLRNG